MFEAFESQDPGDSCVEGAVNDLGIQFFFVFFPAFFRSGLKALLCMAET